LAFSRDSRANGGVYSFYFFSRDRGAPDRPTARLRFLDRLDVEVDRHRLAVAAHQHAFQHLVAAGIDF
jgi:hypothetical protein